MDENEGSGFKERTLDELIGHLTSDVDGDGQYNHMRFTPPHTPPTPRLGSDFATENADPAFIQQRNLFFQGNYQPHQRGSLPFIFNAREDVLPTMVDVGGGNYVVYGAANAQRNQNVPNLHFINKTNGTLTGFNDYGVEFSGTDYNLFRRMAPHSQATVPQFSQATENNAKGQLIENLVGNWASDQSGTYSPFGSSLGGVRTTGTTDSPGIGRGSRRTRIVAEVRPMRPSYSDVLSKSITNNQKPSNKNCQDSKLKTNDAKIKTLKSSIGRTLSSNGNILNRQHSSGGDDSGLNSSARDSNLKKSDFENEPQEGLSKKWLSLDDLKDTSQQDEYITLNDVKNKRNSPKNMSNKTSGKKEKWETIQLNNAKNVAGTKSSQPQKKPEKNTKTPGGPREAELQSGQKFEAVRNKTLPGEERRGPPTNQGKSEQQKTTRRTPRNTQPEKHRKSVKNKKKDNEPSISTMLKLKMDRCGGMLLFALRWLLRLVLDVLGLSTHLAIHMCAAVWASAVSNTAQLYSKLSHSISNIELLQRILNSRFSPFKKAKSSKDKPPDSDDESDDSEPGKTKNQVPRGLKRNISLPSTGEEAMKRLLACKGKDPYSILGVTQDCTDDDIKKYYKRQAFLVHPDKNNQPGAEEAFKILVHAFDIIGEPEHRKSYDRRVEKTQVEQAAWTELSDLLSQLHKKMEYVANTIRCTNCSKRHKRTTVDRPIYAARMCSQCKIHHSVREGDIWAETTLFGFLWHYYACMDGAVYDITEWAGCQGSNLRNLKANTHNVQYRIVLGKHQGQKPRYQHPAPTSEPYLEDFLNNLYTKSEGGASGAEADPSSSAAGRKRKTKRKK